MAGVFPDNEQFAANLEATAKRLRQTDQIGGQAQVRAEQLRIELAEMTEFAQARVDERNALRAELETAQAELAAARDNATRWWFDAVRGELSHDEYKSAVEVKDASECLRLLRVPVLTPAKEIPAARLRVQLSPLRARLKGMPEEVQSFWNATLDDITAFTSISMDDPLTRSLFDAAHQLGLLTSEEITALEKLPVSPLDRLGITQVVTSPTHITQAMGW